LKEKVVLIEERGTTEEAKRRYFEERKGKGLIWLVRKWLNLPDRPLDDLSAQIIGERFLKFKKY
jgi:RNase H-fold protein (predicted Holliday junction resolvase)